MGSGTRQGALKARAGHKGGSSRRLIASDETMSPVQDDGEGVAGGKKREKEGEKRSLRQKASVLVDAIVIWRTAGCVLRP